MTDQVEEFLREGMEHASAPIRAGEDFCAEAVRRGARLRRRRRASVLLGVGVTAGAAVIAASSLAGRWGDQGVPEPASPTVVDRPTASPNTGKHEPVLLDSIELDDGRRIELIARGNGAGPCLQVVGVDERIRECGRAPSEREPSVDAAITAEAIAQRTNSSPFEIYGATSDNVTRVEVTHAAEGGQQSRQAYLLRCTDKTALDQAGISEPFGYFFAELPASTTASAVTVVAIGRDGRPLGSTDFSAYRDQPLEAFVSGPS